MPVLRARPAAAVALAAAGFSVVAAVAPAYNPITGQITDGWISVLLLLLAVGYLLVSTGVAAHSCLAPLGTWRGPAAAANAAAHAPTAVVSLGRQRLAAAVLALIVVIEGFGHLGERSGAWATSRPLDGRAEVSADGYVAWVQGLPVHGEALYSWSQVDALSQRRATLSQEFLEGNARIGQGLYAFFVALVARITSSLGSAYAAFAVVNLAFWWGGAMAVHDLARRASGSWWVGLMAGALTATGIGFSFTAGNILSNTAAYGALALVLWLTNRLRVLEPGGPISDLLLVGSLAGATALFYSLAPFLIAFAALHYVGRCELRRLLVYALMVLAVGQLWAQLLQLTAATGPPTPPGYFSHWVASGGSTVAEYVADHRAALVGVVGSGFVVAAFIALPRRLAEPLVGLSAASFGMLVVFAVALAPRVVRGWVNTATTSLNLPRYLGDLGDVSSRASGQFVGSLGGAIEAMRLSFIDAHLSAAFPGTLCVLALVGVVGLKRRWVDWCAALVVVAAVQTILMNAGGGAPHPRLTYFCFPAIYLLAANGASNAFRAMAWLGARLQVDPRVNLAVAGVVTALLLAPPILASNASWWGDWSYDLRFHYLWSD